MVQNLSLVVPTAPCLVSHGRLTGGVLQEAVLANQHIIGHSLATLRT